MNNNNTSKPLTLFERERIGVYFAQGKSKREIGRLLRRSHTTISRELKRNRYPHPLMRGYVSCLAQQQAQLRKSEGGQRARLKSEEIRTYVESKLTIGWTPEQIANRLRLDRPNASISHEAIYQYIYTDWREGIQLLVRKRPYRYSKGLQCGRKKPPILNRVSIDERPSVINERKEGGHWECDLIICDGSKTSIQVLHERMSRLVQLALIPNRKAKTAKEAIVKNLSAFPRQAIKSITYDNGSENYRHDEVNTELGIKSFFCNPYHSWEKGAVENTNSLIRRWVPKKMNLSLITKEQIKQIEERLNARPRKCLGFKNPNEAFCSLYGASPP